MSNKPIQRVAFVKLTSQGKSYAMRCDRKDLVAEDDVEIQMYVGTNRAYLDQGVITSISYHRWDCSCHVINHIKEVSYSFDGSDGLKLIRTVDLSRLF